MKKTLTIIGTVLLVAAIAAPVLARGPAWGKGHHGARSWKGGPGYCCQYGTLTEEQRDQLDKLHQKFYDETAQLRNEIRSKRGELNRLLNSTSPDVEKATTLQNEISDLMAQMAQKRIDLKLEVRKIAPEVQFGRRYGRGYRSHKRGHGPGMGYDWHMKDYGPDRPEAQ
jgi:Spy/CpxP family protein refolding chaperone